MQVHLHQRGALRLQLDNDEIRLVRAGDVALALDGSLWAVAGTSGLVRLDRNGRVLVPAGSARPVTRSVASPTARWPTPSDARTRQSTAPRMQTPGRSGGKKENGTSKWRRKIHGRSDHEE